MSAVITNLADEAPLVARMRDALSGEVNRRQEMLRSAGNLANIAEYQPLRGRGAGLAPMPALFIVVDEFSELLSQHPDFADLFVAIGRLGRSLGIHLLLASQRLDEGRLRGLETHLSYRICLKTFSAGDSRAVLGVPDAYHLPSRPGAAYLKTASGEATRFQTAFVSGGLRPAAQAGGARPGTAVHASRCPPAAGRRTDDAPRRSARCSTPCWPRWRAGAAQHTACGCRRSAGHRCSPSCSAQARSRTCGCRSVWSTARSSSVTSHWCSTSAARRATPPSWALRSRESPPCCAPWCPRWPPPTIAATAQFYCLDLGGGALAPCASSRTSDPSPGAATPSCAVAP